MQCLPMVLPKRTGSLDRAKKQLATPFIGLIALLPAIRHKLLLKVLLEQGWRLERTQ